MNKMESIPYELQVPPTPYFSLLGIVELTMLRNIHTEQETTHGEQSSEAARQTIDLFQEHVAFNLELVRQILKTGNSVRTVPQDTLELWVKFAYLYHLKNAGTTVNTIKRVANGILGAEYDVNGLVGCMCGKGNLVELLQQRGFGRIQQRALKQSRSNEFPPKKARTVIKKALSPRISPRATVSPYKEFAEGVQAFVKPVLTGTRLPNFSSILKLLKTVIQRYKGTLPLVLNAYGASSQIVQTLEKHAQIITDVQNSGAFSPQIPLSYLYNLLLEMNTKMQKSKENLSQISALCLRLKSLIQIASEQRRILIQQAGFGIDGLESHLIQAEQDSLAQTCLKLCKQFRQLVNHSKTAQPLADSLYSQVQQAHQKLHHALTNLKRLGDSLKPLRKISQSLHSVLTKMQSPQSPVIWQKLTVHLPCAIAQHIKHYNSLFDNEKHRVLNQLKESFPEYSNMSVFPLKDAPDNYKKSLQFSLADFRNIRKRLLHNGDPTQECDLAIRIFRDALSKPVPNEQDLKITGEDAISQGLREIFTFYAQQSSLVGNSAGSESIKIGKFLSFCRDFKIAEKPILDEKQVQRIFFENSDKGIMNYENFILAIDELAQAFFQLQYDSVHKSNLAGLDYLGKVKMMYRFLECDSPMKYGRKMKGSGNPYYVGAVARDLRRVLRSQSPVMRCKVRLNRSPTHQIRWRI